MPAWQQLYRYGLLATVVTLLDFPGVVRRFAQSSISVDYFPFLGGSAVGLTGLVLIVVEM